MLLDKNIHGALRPFLERVGHDVTAVGAEYPPRMDDPAILAMGMAESRVIVTNDRDFGDLVVRAGLPHAGVVILRLPVRSAEYQCARLIEVLQEYADQFPALIVVTEGGVRMRR